MTKKLPLVILVLLLMPGAAFLRAQPNVTAWNLLLEGFNDKNLERRRQAVAAIGSVGLAPEAIQMVEKALHDAEPQVRQTAAAVLGQMRSHKSISALQVLLDDEAGEVAFTAAKALWDLGDRSGKGIIQDVLTGQRKDTPGLMDGAMQDAKAKLHSPKTLAMIGVKEASGALLGPFGIGVYAAEQAFKDTSVSGRTLAATMLGEHCDARAQQLLEWDMTEDRNWAVKAACARALGQCGNPEAIPKLEQNLADSHDAVKYMAAAAIVRLSLKPPSAAGP
jgi:HEAT repeat protein